MDKGEFQEYLAERKLNDEQIATAISLVERFEASCAPTELGQAGREEVNAFAAQMEICSAVLAIEHHVPI